MISTDLANTADFVLGYARRQEPLQPHAAACLAAQLLDLSRQVRAMEEVPLRLDSPEVSLIPPKPRTRANAR